jgi:hypothetical protein
VSALIVERSVDTNTVIAQRIDEILTEREFRKLAYHLGSTNTNMIILGFLTNWDLGGTPKFARSRRVSCEDAYHDSWRSLRGELTRKNGEFDLPIPFAAVVPKADGNKQSNWLTFDVDCHHGENPRYSFVTARKIYHNASEWLKPLGADAAILWENSGRGHHVTIVTALPQVSGFWRRLIGASTCEADCGIEIIGIGQKGPPGCRLPGTANPNTWDGAHGTYEVSLIYQQSGLRELLKNLQDPPQQSEKRPAGEFDRTLARFLEKCRIVEYGTRNTQLTSLIGRAVYQCGGNEEILMRLASAQWDKANCNTDLEAHRIEARIMIRSWRDRLVDELNPNERKAYEGIRCRKEDDSRAQKEAFLIARNFSKFCKPSREFDFPVELVGDRVGVPWSQIRNWRNAWVKRGWIKVISPAITMVKAARFRWELF